jgi:3',5'-cyclic AMP phosphodiesterase CpdA
MERPPLSDVSERPLTRIAQVSDPHLGADVDQPRQAAALAALESLATALPTLDLDAVIVSGDVIIDDPDDQRDHKFAHNVLARLDLPVWIVPGNHDVGDHRVRAGLPPDWHGAEVTSVRVRAWHALWGRSYWRHDVPGWRLYGLNSQVMGSGLAEEADQWSWLHLELGELLESHPSTLVAVFMHEGVIAPRMTPPRDAWMNVPTDSGSALLEMLGRVDLRLIASGHTHRHASEETMGIWHVTAPSITGPIPLRPDMLQAIGHREPGVLVYTFAPGGFTFEFMTTEQHGPQRRFYC